MWRGLRVTVPHASASSLDISWSVCEVMKQLMRGNQTMAHIPHVGVFFYQTWSLRWVWNFVTSPLLSVVWWSLFNHALLLTFRLLSLDVTLCGACAADVSPVQSSLSRHCWLALSWRVACGVWRGRWFSDWEEGEVTLLRLQADLLTFCLRTFFNPPK